MRKSNSSSPSAVHARRLRALERAYDRLRRKLVRTGYLAIGSITVMRLRCGQPTCRCQTHPRHRHGPYVCWTTKVRGRTVSRLLRKEEARLYQKWIENRRRLDRTVQEMLETSRDAAALILTEKHALIPGRHRTYAR
jgi:hypothetical protein